MVVRNKFAPVPVQPKIGPIEISDLAELSDEEIQTAAAELPLASDMPMETDEVRRQAEAFDPTARVTAIPTLYNHCTFRSRAEARWALFFDVMGIAWEHETEGLRLPSGHQYLPDFYLPQFRWFGECKPTFQIQQRERKAELFAEKGGVNILLLTGAPAFHAYIGLSGPFEGIEYSLDTENYPKATIEGRLWSCPDYSPSIGNVYQFSERYVRAVTYSRSERFGA